MEGIILFGSRGRSTHNERSDVDLALVCPTATDKDWLTVLSILAEADTLLKIDCIRLDTLRDPKLRAEIVRDGKELYRRNH